MRARKSRPPLPGRKRRASRIAEMIRVDHAGEYGAVTIYAGQKDVFKTLPHKARITRDLEEQEADEQAHLDAFDGLIASERVRPTALAPVWRLGGHTLGVATAFMGERAVHACTEAVETVIETHYAEQIEELEAMGETKLAARFTQFREEELAHRDHALDEGAKDAVGYPVLSKAIEIGCRIAIKVSERI